MSCVSDLGSALLHGLSQVDAKLGDLLESTPDAIVVVDALGIIVLVNSLAEQLFRYDRDELLGQSVEVLLPDSFRRQHVAHRAGYFQQPHTRTMGAGLELYGLRKDGVQFPVEISLSPLKTERGTLVMSAVRDISGRQRAEKKFAQLLESAPDAMVIVNGHGVIVLVNSQTEKLFGYRREQLLGQSVDMLVPTPHRARHPAHRQAFFQNPRARAMGTGFELNGLRADGSEFPVEISLSPLETEDGLFVSSAIRDVTERKRFEQALRDKNLELENAAKVKDRFLASMSHELRTPLNAIIGFTSTLLMRMPGPVNTEQERQLTTIQSSARHLHSLINDLLDLAKIEAGKVDLLLEPVSCRAVLEEVEALLAQTAEAKGLLLQLELPHERLTVQADRRALTQILLNLTNNAIKFTAHGTVRIACGKSTRAGNILATIFTVEDTGIGISHADQARLFESFQRLGAAAGRREDGSGLGLHLSQRLASMMKGKIVCESEMGKGSRFIVVIDGEATA
ncbi:MAG: PAS domain-containing sensor histidine kinase [Polaromonas sp.]|nr:PAS domain-containing sensor histidine kinase [Polaromonas sp.]